MAQQNRLNVKINLASHPLRNRRLYFLIFWMLVIAVSLVFIGGGWTYFRYKGESKKIESSIAKIEKAKNEAQREEEYLSSGITRMKEKHEKKIELLNSLIYKKSFSWVDFLSDLEHALPDSACIVSLTPAQKGDTQMDVRLQVASFGVSELLELVKRLDSMRFKEIKVMSESKDDRGFLISEVSFIYEKNI
ncbi:MAG: hypothetical protein IBX60_07270 [Candidatus Aminicenantes bacterium]|nr:hypothetical protein [Candidatus Aminicenantes bacterium]